MGTRLNGPRHSGMFNLLLICHKRNVLIQRLDYILFISFQFKIQNWVDERKNFRVVKVLEDMKRIGRSADAYLFVFFGFVFGHEVHSKLQVTDVQFHIRSTLVWSQILP